MTRNMQKWIDEYYKECRRRKYAGSCAFYTQDVLQIAKIAGAREVTTRGVLLSAVMDALAAGWSIGYRAAQREYRKRQQECPRTAEKN